MLTVIIVEKSGLLKSLNVKEYKEQELYKKCGFKKAEDFLKQTTWKVKYEGQHFSISLYGKTDGKAGNENKYEFPPPVDNKLFFGSCVLVGQIYGCNDNINLTIPLWNKLYEKLYGGFEDLEITEFDTETDDIKKKPLKIPKKEISVDSESESLYSNSDDEDEDNDNESVKSSHTEESNESDEIKQIECGSELEEEEYDYDE